MNAVTKLNKVKRFFLILIPPFQVFWATKKQTIALYYSMIAGHNSFAFFVTTLIYQKGGEIFKYYYINKLFL